MARTVDDERMKQIQIFGVGCAKYRTLLDNLRQALAALRLDLRVEELDDIQLFFDKNITEVPTLMVDGKILCKGEAPSIERLVAILYKEEQAARGK